MRSERWKYIHYPALADADELYDLQADPGELRNLIGAPGAQGALKEMQQELQHRLRESQ